MELVAAALGDGADVPAHQSAVFGADTAGPHLGGFDEVEVQRGIVQRVARTRHVDAVDGVGVFRAGGAADRRGVGQSGRDRAGRQEGDARRVPLQRNGLDHLVRDVGADLGRFLVENGGYRRDDDFRLTLTQGKRQADRGAKNNVDVLADHRVVPGGLDPHRVAAADRQEGYQIVTVRVRGRAHKTLQFGAL